MACTAWYLFYRTVEREFNRNVSHFRTRTADTPSLRTDPPSQPGLCSTSTHETAFMVFSCLISENFFRPPDEFTSTAIPTIGGRALFRAANRVTAGRGR